MSTSPERPQGTIRPVATSPRPIDPGVTIGHVHLRTADIDRIRGFYVDVLGFEVVAEARGVPGWGTTGDILFVSAGAIRYPTRAGLADALRRLREVNWPLRQTADHGTHEAIYITDPDGNDVELYWDRPIEEWPVDEQGHLRGQFGDELDLEDLLSAAPPA